MKRNNTISDELLSAFLDGNTDGEDTMRVLEAAADDNELQEAIRIAREVDDDFTAVCEPEVIPMMAMAARKKENYLCDVECEEFVLHQLGIEVTHKSLLDMAYKNCWLRKEGMPLYNIGRLLEKNCLSVSRRYGATLEDIARLSAAGNQLIAVVDDALLSGDAPLDASHPNHAVAVSSVTDDGQEIVLFNPNADEELSVYSTAAFRRAWKQSGCYLVVVNITDRFVYEPSPIALDDVALDDSLIDLQEAIAENAHEVWAQARAAEGWTYGPERNDLLKQTPDMVPYCNLTEGEKRYDRDMAIQTLKLVRKLGFEIKRKN